MPSNEWDAYVQAMLEGRYFEAHEILEVPWRQNRDVRLQIAIWIAAAFVHWSKGNTNGARRLFLRALNIPESKEIPIRPALERWIRHVDTRSLEHPTPTELEALGVWAVEK